VGQSCQGVPCPQACPRVQGPPASQEALPHLVAQWPRGVQGGPGVQEAPGAPPSQAFRCLPSLPAARGRPAVPWALWGLGAQAPPCPQGLPPGQEVLWPQEARRCQKYPWGLPSQASPWLLEPLCCQGDLWCRQNPSGQAFRLVHGGPVYQPHQACLAPQVFLEVPSFLTVPWVLPRLEHP